MVPAWATVTLALGAALIGALTGLTGAFLQRRSARDELVHKETEAWRTTLVETTEEFIDAWHEFRAFLRARTIESEALPFDTKAKQQVDPLGTKCAQTIDKVMLVFGRTTECGQAAAELDKEIWRLKQLVLKTPTEAWENGAKSTVAGILDAINKPHDKFVGRAHIACKPTRWNEPNAESERPPGLRTWQPPDPSHWEPPDPSQWHPPDPTRFS